MRVISTKNTLLQFKVGDVIRVIEAKRIFTLKDILKEEKTGTFFRSKDKYKVIRISKGIILLKNVRYTFSSIEISLSNIEGIIGWQLNKEWLKNKRKTHVYRYDSGGYWSLRRIPLE